MFNDEYGTDSMDHVKSSIKERKRKIRRRKRRILFRKILRVTLILGVFASIYYIDKHEITRIRDVRITGNITVPENEIIEKLNLYSGKRIITHLPFTLNSKASSVIGVDTFDTSIYYRQGIVNVVVHEKKVVGYTQGEMLQVLYEDGTSRDVTTETLQSISGLPLFSNFKEDQLNEEYLKVFAELGDEVLYTISEVHAKPEKFDETAMKLVMNNNYYVFSSLKTLPLLRSYASIIGRADKESRCIYLLEYGPNEDSQLATVKPCE